MKMFALSRVDKMILSSGMLEKKMFVLAKMSAIMTCPGAMTDGRRRRVISAICNQLHATRTSSSVAVIRWRYRSHVHSNSFSRQTQTRQTTKKLNVKTPFWSKVDRKKKTFWSKVDRKKRFDRKWKFQILAPTNMFGAQKRVQSSPVRVEIDEVETQNDSVRAQF